MFETGQTSSRQPLDFSFVSRSLKQYSTKSSSFERTTRLLEHYTACEHVISMETRVELWNYVEWLYSPCIVRLNTLPNNAMQCRSYKVECCIVRLNRPLQYGLG